MNIVLNFILFDLKAFRNTFFKVLPPYLITTNLFYFHFYPWDGYFMSACMLITVMFSIPIFMEKKYKLEMVKCSLPATRLNIVFSRYFLSFIIAIITIFLFYINVYIADFLYTDPTAVFAQYNHFKILFMALFLISIHSSTFLPSVFAFRYLGTIITFIIALIIAITLTVIIFHPDRDSFVHHFQPEDSFMVLILAIIMVISLIGSMKLSIQLYKRKDL